MTLKDYIDKLKVFFCCSQAALINILFKAAGSKIDIPENTAKSWLKKDDKNRRNCDTPTYFPDRKIDENEFISCLKRQINGEWKELQGSFSELNEENIINLETNNEDEFYWSMLNQFQKLLKIQLSVKTNTENSNFEREMVRSFREYAEQCEISRFINTEPTQFLLYKNLFHYDLQDLAKDFIQGVESNIIEPFKPHEETLIYINILRFVSLVRKYNEYLITHSMEIKAIQIYYKSPSEEHYKSETINEQITNIAQNADTLC